MMIGSVSIILILGMLMLLILFQISTGLRWLKVPFKVHKKTGGALLFSAAFHAFLAIFAG